MIPLENTDLSKPEFKANPFPFYARLRAERPICRVPVSRGEEIIVLSRYDDVSAILKDPRLAKDPANALTPEQMSKQRKVPKFLSALFKNILALDDPDHARLRRLVQAVFTPRRVEALEAHAQKASTDLLDRLEKRQHFDLIADYALPLPVKVISDLLGVPHKDQTRFAHWSHALIKVGSAPPMSAVMLVPSILSFVRYLKKLIEMKRLEPADDLVTALVEAEQSGETLSSEELMAMISILLSAGHETTTNLIGNGMLALMRNPEQRERLAGDRALTETAIEELLRFEGPVEMSTHRYAREPIEIAGAIIPQGAVVMGAIASANRDESRFTAPDELDIGRAQNRHLTFGAGGHYCLGASLARMEGKIAFQDLFERLPELRLRGPVSDLNWRRGLVLRGLESFPVER